MRYKALALLLGMAVPLHAADEMRVLKGTCEDSKMTVSADGSRWATDELHCTSAVVQAKAGRTAVAFGNCGPEYPIISFRGALVGGEAPVFLTEVAALQGDKAEPIAPVSGSGCHFFFSDHGGFTPGWQDRLTAIKCDLKLTRETGSFVRASVSFTLSADR